MASHDAYLISRSLCFLLTTLAELGGCRGWMAHTPTRTHTHSCWNSHIHNNAHSHIIRYIPFTDFISPNVCSLIQKDPEMKSQNQALEMKSQNQALEEVRNARPESELLDVRFANLLSFFALWNESGLCSFPLLSRVTRWGDHTKLIWWPPMHSCLLVCFSHYFSGPHFFGPQALGSWRHSDTNSRTGTEATASGQTRIMILS